jgi:hypothetical protein
LGRIKIELRWDCIFFLKKKEEDGIVLDQIILGHGLVGRVQIPGFISIFFFFGISDRLIQVSVQIVVYHKKQESASSSRNWVGYNDNKSF